MPRQNSIRFFQNEAIERELHISTKEELARQKTDMWWRPPQWNYTATGRLSLMLESCEFPSISRSWSDGKRRKLDTCLGEVPIACKKIAAAIKQERVDRAEAERMRREEEKRRMEEAARKAEYERKAKAVKALAQQWQESKLLRGLLKGAFFHSEYGSMRTGSRRFPIDFSIHPRKLSWIRRQKSGGPESKAPP